MGNTTEIPSPLTGLAGPRGGIPGAHAPGYRLPAPSGPVLGALWRLGGFLVICWGCLIRTGPAGAEEVSLVKDDTLLDRGAVVKAGVYRIADSGDDGAVRILGDGISVDFQGADLVGCVEGMEPDAYCGRGIVIRGRNVTLKNAKVRGYKVGIFAEDSPGLSLLNCDVSRNYRQRLKSTPQREDQGDWLYGHENDANEWLRYGAGIYLLRCPQATVKECRARDGQNGLCLVRCDDSTVIDNDMSYMSGWGLAMWRTSRCDVSNNKFDWCIRGYSHGVYSRGQDSAGILVYEQCSDNVFAYNSATHSGDGFFLYAGNETLQKTGRGGCNRNLLYKNDFSHAAANGIEATFSDGNMFVENRLDECEHGVWAGYSYNTLIAGNHLGQCKNGVSIEHGRDNVIVENSFEDCQLGVHLWWDDDEDLLRSPFAAGQDRCPSKSNRVLANRFESAVVAVRLADDASTIVRWNRMTNVKTGLEVAAGTTGTRFSDNLLSGARIQNETVEPARELLLSPNERADGYDQPAELTRLASRLPPKAKGTREAFQPQGRPRGRKHIRMDEWGPMDPARLP